MAHLFEFEASEVLGVPVHARLEDVREAYRAKSKKHHPDAGGDDWAFRLVNRAYELLCCARVAGRVVEEERADASSAASPRHDRPRAEREPFKPDSGPSAAGPFAEDVRQGARDEGYPTERLIEVEILIVRQEIVNPVDFLLARTEDRNLSCSVSATWPKEGQSGLVKGDATSITAGLRNAFKQTAKAKRPVSQQIQRENGGFSGWLSYTSAREADEAAQALRAALNKVSLGVTQTTRELVVPRV